jgi:hypothetical protein
MKGPRVAACLAAAITCWALPLGAQSVAYRGFADARGALFPQDSFNDTQNLVIDFLGRAEIFAKPWPWLQFAAGVDLRANSYDQVDDRWRFDFKDRGALRPRASIRRLTATLARGPLTLDAGKQFIRWGKTDIVTPTDRFAPRDFINVIDNDVLPVRGVRGVLQLGSHALDAVWVPSFTPSRLPLLDQRWTPVAGGVLVAGDDTQLPERSQIGVRWGQSRNGYEYSLSLFDGFNHLPNVEPAVPLQFHIGQPVTTAIATEPIVIPIRKRYPAMRMYGGDAAVPTPWFTLKSEAAYFTSSTPSTDDYLLYVVQLERQTGEWVLVGGYAGEVVTAARAIGGFAPDRGTSRSFVARASYTIDTNRSAAVEGAVRENGDGLYAKGELSQARGPHWRATLTGVLIRGRPDDFIGQFRVNSHISLGLRYSF